MRILDLQYNDIDSLILLIMCCSRHVSAFMTHKFSVFGCMDCLVFFVDMH